VFTRREGSAADMYPGLNRRTVLQRISAALIFPLLIVHINTFAWMRACREKGYFILVGLIIMAQIGFFAAVITHVSVSFTNAFVTLGLLSSPEKKAAIDRVVYVIGAVLFLASVGVVVNGQIRMILMG
ncbi:MAG: hypothetical protein K6E33_09015, partial [Lachnospiraceae bacterium]|nr:hypothetical protein [Lachnospiraceae bacterium]